MKTAVIRKPDPDQEALDELNRNTINIDLSDDERELAELNKRTTGAGPSNSNKSKLRSLYEGVSSEFEIGTYEEFEQKMQNADKRKAFYDGIKDYYDIGDTYEEFESRLNSESPEGTQKPAGMQKPVTNMGDLSLPASRFTKPGDLGFGNKKENLTFTQAEQGQRRAKLDYEQALREQEKATSDSGQGRVMSYIGSINQAFYGLPADVLDAVAIGAKKIDELLPEGMQSYEGKQIKDLSTAKAADWYRNALKELAPTNPAYQQEIGSQVSSAIGNLASLALTGGLTKSAQGLSMAAGQGSIVTSAGKELLTKMATPSALQGGIQMGVGQFREAKQAGANDNVAFDQFIKNAAVGSVLEQIPIQLFYKRLDAVTGGGVKTLLKKGFSGGTEEMTTEVLQQLYSNMEASKTYDQTRKLLDGVGESGGIGFGLGFMLNAMGVSLKRKMNDAKTPQEQAQITKAMQLVDEQARKNLTSTEKQIPYQEPPQPKPKKTAGSVIAQIDNQINALYANENMTGSQLQQAAETERQLTTEKQVIQEAVINKKTAYAQESLQLAKQELEQLNEIINNPPTERALQRAGQRIEQVQDDIDYWTTEINSIVESIDMSAIPLDELITQQTQLKSYLAEDTISETDSPVRAEETTEAGNEVSSINQTPLVDDIGQKVEIEETSNTVPQLVQTQEEITSQENEDLLTSPNNTDSSQLVTQSEVNRDTEVNSDNMVPEENSLTAAIEGNIQQAAAPSGLKDINAVVYNPSTGVSFLLDDFIKPVINTSGRLFKKYFTAQGFLPTQVFKEQIKTSGAINAGIKQIEYTSADFRNTIKKAYRGKATAQHLSDINQALTGNRAVYNSLPLEVQQIVTRMRAEIDNLSRRMINEGVVTGDLAAKIQANQGVYISRSYQKFDNKTYSEDIDPVIVNRAKGYIAQEYNSRGINLTDQQLEGIINELLFNPEAPMAIIKGGKLGSKDISVLKQRKDIAPEIRALLGEYSDPLLNYARSVVKMVNLIEKHHFLTNVRQEGLNKFLFEKPTGEHYVQIAGDKSNTMNPLNGLYTTENIAEAFASLDKITPTYAVYEYWMKALATIKFAKTVGSVTTHIRNFLSNTAFVMANGHWRLGNAGSAARTVFTDLSRKNDTGLREAYKRYVKLGIVGDSAGIGEFKNILKDAIGKEDFFTAVSDSKLIKLRNKVGGATVRLYQAEDDVYKIFAFENELARYSKAYPNKPVAEVEQLAADIVRNTYPTYSMTPAVVKALRAFPLAGTFVSFPAEVVRTTFNTLAQARKELSSPETRSIGIERTSGILFVTMLFSAVPAVSRYVNGVSEEEEKDLRQFVAPWSKNSQLLFTGSVEHGKTSFIDLSYVDPHAYLKKPVIAMLDGKGDIQENGLTALQELYEPFVGANILAQAMLEIRANEKENGGQIYNEQLPIGDILFTIGGYLLSQAEPGTITSFKRIYKGLNGEVNKSGEPYDADREVLATFTGQRITEVNVEKSLSYRMYDLTDSINESERIYKNLISKKSRISEAEKRQALTNAIEAVRNNIQKLREHLQGARRLGVKEESIMTLLKDARISRPYKMLSYVESPLPEQLLGYIIRVNSKEMLTAEERQQAKEILAELGLK
jgi:hypothetical protein